MRNNSLKMLVALVFGTVAVIVATQMMNTNANNDGKATTEIFVAAVTIDIGEEITPERIRLEQWPSDKIPEGASGNLELLEDKYAKQRFYAGEPIMPVKLMDENWTTVPKGYRVVAMRASESNIANLVQPGDRVDVMAYFKKSDMISREMTKTVLMGIRVYALDGDTQRRAGEDRPSRINNIQLLIHENDTDAWTYANELGRVRLSLGSDADYSSADGSNEAGQEFLAWLDEHRKNQEEAARRAEEAKRASERQPRTKVRAVPEGEEGYSMFKMHGGKMYEYWIVKGKLPKYIGVVGGESDDPTAEGGEAEPKVTDDQGLETGEDDLDYLNGEESPFYQESTNGKSKY